MHHITANFLFPLITLFFSPNVFIICVKSEHALWHFIMHLFCCWQYTYFLEEASTFFFFCFFIKQVFEFYIACIFRKIMCMYVFSPYLKMLLLKCINWKKKKSGYLNILFVFFQLQILIISGNFIFIFKHNIYRIVVSLERFGKFTLIKKKKKYLENIRLFLLYFSFYTFTYRVPQNVRYYLLPQKKQTNN